jgi:hypothetical protein
MLQKFNLKITGAAADGFDFSQGFQFNIQMSADLDQFR